jgi:hypothetical protein
MKLYLLKPFSLPDDMEDRIFRSSCNILRVLLAEKGIHLTTYDMGDIKDADRVIFFNLDEELLRRCLDAQLEKDKLVLFLFEPRVVVPGQYQPEVWKYFGRIFTFCDDLIEKFGFTRMFIPQGQSHLPGLTPFGERKLMTLINSNKYSFVEGELYSLRRRAIRFFEASPLEFDLYGVGWGNNPFFAFQLISYARMALAHRQLLSFMLDAFKSLKRYSSYRGTVVDKIKALDYYKFCICFENEACDGYITEKIFDCLFAGTVPIYLGAPNVERYIPGETFIDMRAFSDFSTLGVYLNGMSEEDFAAKQSAGRHFLTSREFEKWKPEAVFKSIVAGLEGGTNPLTDG